MPPCVSAARRAMEIGRSETVDVGGAQDLPQRLRAAGAADHRRRGAYRAVAGADGDHARLRRHRRRSARRLGHDQPLPRREGGAGMGRRGLREDGPRRLDRRGDADARSQARRSGARSGAQVGRLLCRRARQPAHPCQAQGAAGRGRHHRRAVRPHPRTGRPQHRRQVAGRDRRVDPGPDHRGAGAPPRRAGRRPRWPPREIRRDAHRRGGRRHPGAQLARQRRQLRQGPRAVGRRRRQAEGGRRVDRGRGAPRSRRHPRGRGGGDGRQGAGRRGDRGHRALHRPLQPLRPRGRARRGRSRAHRRAERARRIGDRGDPAAVRAGRAAPDGGHGQDHSLCRAAHGVGARASRWRSRPTSRWSRSRRSRRCAPAWCRPGCPARATRSWTRRSARPASG